MGICDTGKNISNINNLNYSNQRKEESLINGSEIIQINSYLYSICRSICKIIYSYNGNYVIGTGFLIKLFIREKQLFCIMSNEHIIKKEIIDKNMMIEVYYDNQRKKRNKFK